MIGFLSNFLTTYSDKVFTILVTLIGALILSLVLELLFKSWSKHAPTKRAQTVLSVFLNAIKIGIFIAAFLTILSTLHVDITPVLASAGILGLAIGFGSQLLIRDIITGTFLIFENQFNAGDRVRIGTIDGIVEHVGLRTLTIRDETGAVHSIPNGAIDKLANLSKSWSQANITITVPAQNNVDKVLTVIQETVKSLESNREVGDKILQPAIVLALEDFTENKMSFKVVIRTKNEMDEDVARHFRYELKKNFEKEKIILS